MRHASLSTVPPHARWTAIWGGASYIRPRKETLHRLSLPSYSHYFCLKINKCQQHIYTLYNKKLLIPVSRHDRRNGEAQGRDPPPAHSRGEDRVHPPIDSLWVQRGPHVIRRCVVEISGNRGLHQRPTEVRLFSVCKQRAFLCLHPCVC